LLAGALRVPCRLAYRQTSAQLSPLYRRRAVRLSVLPALSLHVNVFASETRGRPDRHRRPALGPKRWRA
jgi:hypothetical protein